MFQGSDIDLQRHQINIFRCRVFYICFYRGEPDISRTNAVLFSDPPDVIADYPVADKINGNGIDTFGVLVGKVLPKRV